LWTTGCWGLKNFEALGVHVGEGSAFLFDEEFAR
jgi:hypothetical protein